MYVNNLTTKGTIDATGIDFEASSDKGYGDTFKVIANLNNINLINGDFDIGVLEGSVITANNVKSDCPFYLFAKDSKITINNSEFAIGPNDNIIYPYDVTFNSCIFTASEDKVTEKNNVLYAGPIVNWNISGTAYKNQKLTFNDCTFTANGNIEDADTVYGIYTGIDVPSYNNVLTVNGGTFSDKLDIGIKTVHRGGTWKIKDTTMNCDLAFSWNGYSPTGGGEYVNILIDGAKIYGSQFMEAGDYTPAGSNLNRLEVKNLYLNEDSSDIRSFYGLRGTLYLGNSTIRGTGAPLSSNNAFVGDIYTDGTSQWKCTKGGYLSYGGEIVASEWLKIK